MVVLLGYVENVLESLRNNIKGNTMYKDFESLFERFSIMTIDGNIPDVKALEILKSQTIKELYNQLEKVVYKK